MAVTQTISTIPDAGHRGVDIRETFVTKQEAFQDHLSSTFVSQINTFKTQLNDEITTFNNNLTEAVTDATIASISASTTIAQNSASTATQKAIDATNSANSATNSASTATQKAIDATNSASQALTYKNQLQGYVIPAGTSYSVEQLNTQNSAFSKAQFNALAEERKANRAGSGWDEWGKHHSSTSTLPNINEGIWTNPISANNLFIGNVSGAFGVSKTNPAIACINGVISKIAYTNIGGNQVVVSLPTAPTIYPHDTVLTAEQIASGVIKHADASNSGLIVNGKGLTGTTFTQTITVVNGKKYIIEYKDNGVRKTLEVTTSSTSYSISLSGTDITEVGMYPLDAISRSDLVFLESWHEDIAEKGIVYPLGNTQYLGGNTDGLTGIANGAFTGFETYSSFGSWQTPSALIGKGYVWSSLTEAQKRAFIVNHDNNCYLDGDKVIQVRYRVRVVQGWNDLNTLTVNPFNNYFYFDSSIYIKPKGKQVSVLDLSNSASGGIYGHGTTSWVASLSYANEFGMFSASNTSGSTTGFTAGAYDGKCFALPIALVHR